MKAPAIQALRSEIMGSALLPGEAGYDEARVSFNGMLDRRPALVVRCATTADVVAAARCAAALDLPISVRGGGHSVAGHGLGDEALTIDLSQMRAVTVDADRRVARVEGGALWEDVDTATQAVGLAVPGGTYVDTGVGGLTLGGGIGWLLGSTGLTCDNLRRAEVVTAAGKRVIAGDDGDPELLWALRGGGGNFGVVTTFEFDLHPCTTMSGGYLSFAADDTAPVLETTEALRETLPDELVIMIDLDDDEQTGDRRCYFGVAYAGEEGALRTTIAPVLEAARPYRDAIGPKTYLEIQAMNGTLPFGLRHYWKGHFLDALEPDAVGAVVEAASARPGIGSILLEVISGTARRTPEETAAFALRRAGWNVSAIGIWEDSADDEIVIDWARALAASLEPFSATGGGYVNYVPPDETPERVRAAYGTGRFERLAAVKRRYDPGNSFRFNLNIPPG